MEIAVLIGQNGETGSIHESGKILVYRHSCQIWEVCRSIPFSLQPRKGLAQTRKYMASMLEFLGECRAFVGLSVIGLPYFELEKAGFTIWERSGSPADFLDDIMQGKLLESESASTMDLNIVLARPEPKKVGPGCYSISLKEIQNCNGMLTSKQILFPLLEKMAFESLIIICSHVPPWLEVKILYGEVNGVIHKITPNETRVIISR